MIGYGKSLALGILGFALAWGGWHLIEDHQRLHTLDATMAQLVAGPDGAVRVRSQTPPPAAPEEPKK